MATEKRLIDANDVYALFDKNGTARLHVADIDLIPRVDAVEVVRCKDCKKGHSELAPNGGVWCAKWNHVFNDDGFCSYRERKES